MKIRKRKISMLLPLLGVLVIVSSAQAAVIIDWMPVGDAGNAADDTGNGAVSYDYDMAKYEVTVGQYAEYLNAIGSTDPYATYNSLMDTGGDHGDGGITRSGSSGSYSYSVKTGWANKPMNYVNWYNTLRFTNWLNNDQPTGLQDRDDPANPGNRIPNPATTEDGAYAVLGYWVSPTVRNVEPSGYNIAPRRAEASYFLPTLDEFYKAAYYKGGGTAAGYWDYATQNDTFPSDTLPDTTGNGANIAGNATVDVGSYVLSESAYGTFDQTGNVFEWLETLASGTDPNTFFRYASGGSGWGFGFAAAVNADDISFRQGSVGSFFGHTGFRVGRIIPEPATLNIVALGLLALMFKGRRR